jgi:hypothetical protein
MLPNRSKPEKPYLGCRLLASDQASNGWRQLCANALPVSQAVSSDTQADFGARCHRVVETDALDETAIATVTRIGCDDVEERALFCAATSQTDNDHNNSKKLYWTEKADDYSAQAPTGASVYNNTAGMERAPGVHSGELSIIADFSPPDYH